MCACFRHISNFSLSDMTALIAFCDDPATFPRQLCKTFEAAAIENNGKHEKEKRGAYDLRVREIKHGTFTPQPPLVFSATGGMGPADQMFYRRLAAFISEKQQQSYGTTMEWIRCCLSFSCCDQRSHVYEAPDLSITAEPVSQTSQLM